MNGDTVNRKNSMMSRKKINCIFFLSSLMTLCTLVAGSQREVKIETVTPRFSQLEEAHYDSTNQVLIFADQYGKKFCIHNPRSEKTTCTCQDETTGLIIPIANSTGQYIAGIGHYLVILKWDGVSPQSTYTVLRKVQACNPDIFFNDGNADRHGRLWIGTEANRGPKRDIIPNQANLYYYSNRVCNLKKAVAHVSASGSIAWNSDYTIMYYIDSLSYRVDMFDYNIATGEINNRQPVFDFKKNGIVGLPAGMVTDTRDNLWIACFQGSQIIQVNPNNGQLLRTVILPVSDPNGLAWGGPYLDILYVPTSQFRLNKTERARQKLAGSVLAITGLNAKGRPANNVVLCHQEKQIDCCQGTPENRVGINCK